MHRLSVFLQELAKESRKKQPKDAESNYPTFELCLILLTKTFEGLKLGT